MATSTKGKQTSYASKIQKPVTINLTDDARRALDDWAITTGASRSDLVEHAIRVTTGVIAGMKHGLYVNDELHKSLNTPSSAVETPAVVEALAS